MSKQTAVEWLAGWMNKNNGTTSEDLHNAFEQAKEMEKEQTIDFAKDWWGDDSDLSAKEYYNVTFKK
jgi:hypothetical protein